MQCVVLCVCVRMEIELSYAVHKPWLISLYIWELHERMSKESTQMISIIYGRGTILLYDIQLPMKSVFPALSISEKYVQCYCMEHIHTYIHVRTA